MQGAVLLIIATLEDYAAVRDLLASIFDGLVADGVTPAIRETVEAVPDSLEVTQAQLTTKLKLSPATISWRIKKALRGGWLKNLEVRKGAPARLVRGEPLPAPAGGHRTGSNRV